MVDGQVMSFILWEEGLEVRLVHRKLCRDGLDLLIPTKTGTIFDHINQEKDHQERSTVYDLREVQVPICR